MIRWSIIVVAILAGLVLPFQAGINSQLAKELNHPFEAAVISFLGGLLIMMVFSVVTGGGLMPSYQKMAKISPVLFLGGFLGAVMVCTAIILAPRLGATLLVSCLIVGQLVTSLILDHYGWVGFQEHPVNMMRLLGVACLIVGLLFIRFF